MQDIKERVEAVVFMLDGGDYASSQDKLTLAVIKELTEREAKLMRVLQLIDRAFKQKRIQDVTMINHTTNKIETLHGVIEATLQSLGLQE